VDETAAVIERAKAAGVTRLITLATCLDDLQANLNLAASHPEVSACLGIHPCDVHSAPDDALERLRPEVANPLVAAIGETGLDYFHPAPDGWDETSFRKRQIDFLEAHFTLAAETGLNVVIHTRDRRGDASFQDALAIYRRHSDQVRAVFHCFVGPIENAHALIDLGGLVSFGGVATFKNAGEVLEVATALPPESFMIETDSPYLAPHPHRGERNEPAFVRLVAEKIATSKGMAWSELARRTTATASDFFRISE
jgi:TatD DNase family protein